jgi:hypothetical protein
MVADWVVQDGVPVKYEIIDEDEIKIKWTATMSGQFTLSYGSYVKTIVVESLF